MISLLGLATSLIGTAAAQSINIINNSFEDNPNDGTWIDAGDGSYFSGTFITPIDWIGEGSVNVNEFTPNAQTFAAGLPDGSNPAVCGPGRGNLYQVINAVLTAGETYPLSIHVGDQLAVWMG